jgi:hypothetical protein
MARSRLGLPMHMASRGWKINLLLPGPDLGAGTVAAEMPPPIGHRPPR